LQYDRPADLFAALRGRYDVVIDTEQWHRLSAVIARLTRAPLLIGYATNERSRLFSNPVPYSHDNYEAYSFLNLVEPLGIKRSHIPEHFLTLPSDAVTTAEGLLTDLKTGPFITIFAGASIPERRWGTERFRQVAEQLAVSGYSVVVVGGGEERKKGEEIVAGGLGLNLAGLTSLIETAAVIARSRLVISGDSGVLHLAVGLNVPTVSLFGPGIAAKWAPRGEMHIVLNHNLSCSPCTRFGTTPPCPIGARCLQEISVDEVVHAVGRLLAGFR